MPIFKELDPDTALKLIEGYSNELAEASEKQRVMYDRATCPECGGPCVMEFLSLEHSLPRGALVPRSGLKCERCGCTFDPHSGVIIKTTSAIRPDEAR